MAHFLLHKLCFCAMLLLISLASCDEPSEKEEETIEGSHSEAGIATYADNRENLFKPDPEHVSQKNPAIHSDLMDAGYPDPAEPFEDEEELSDRIGLLQDLLEENAFADNTETHIYASFLYANGLRQKTAFTHDESRVEQLYDESVTVYEDIVSSIDKDDPKFQKVLAGSREGLAFAYAHTDRFSDAFELLVGNVEDFRQKDKWTPYPNWFSAKNAGYLLNLAYQIDEQDWKEEARHQLVQWTEEHENEIGLASATALISYHARQGEADQARTYIDKAESLKDHITNDAAQSDLTENLQSTIERSELYFKRVHDKDLALN